jgi:hypothetical protein
MTVMVIKRTKGEQRPGFIVQFTCRIHKEPENQQDWDDDGERDKRQSGKCDAQGGDFVSNGQLVGREDGHWKMK